MAEDNKKSELAKQLFSLILGMGMGGLVRGSAAPSATLQTLLGNAYSPNAVASNYPTEFAPNENHSYDVIFSPKPANYKGSEPYQNRNQFGKSYANVIDEAGRMQTLDEHNKAIMQFVNTLPAIDRRDPRKVREALHRGLQAEKNLPAFWNESSSRVPFKVSSSAVTGIRLTPDARIEVQWKGSPTWYSFRQFPSTYEASIEAQKLLKADSIGRAVYPVVSRAVKNPSPGLGEWNRPNYDSTYG